MSEVEKLMGIFCAEEAPQGCLALGQAPGWDSLCMLGASKTSTHQLVPLGVAEDPQGDLGPVGRPS